jgi:hypothetical protein
MNFFKKNIIYLFVTASLLITMVSCDLEKNIMFTSDSNADKTSKSMITPTTIKTSKLETELINLAIKHTNTTDDVVNTNDITNTDNTTITNKVISIISIIDMNKKTITSVSKQLNISESAIKSIIFREQLFLGFDDDIADSMVKTSYNDIAQNNLDPKTYTGKIDSSTGLGQIFAKTAISAEISVNKDNSLSTKSFDDIKNMWYQLQNDDKNIYYTALVLVEKSKYLNINIKNANRNNFKKIFARYNGSGKDAVKYSEQTIAYYDLFEKYK